MSRYSRFSRCSVSNSYGREAIEARAGLLGGGRPAHAGARAEVGVGAQQRQLLVAGRAAHLRRSWRRAARRSTRTVAHPRRASATQGECSKTQPMDSTNSSRSMSLRSASVMPPERYTVVPLDTNLAHALAAGQREDRGQRLRPGFRRAAAPARVRCHQGGRSSTRSAALPAPKSPTSSSSAKRLGAGPGGEVQQVGRAER